MGSLSKDSLSRAGVSRIREHKDKHTPETHTIYLKISGKGTSENNPNTDMVEPNHDMEDMEQGYVRGTTPTPTRRGADVDNDSSAANGASAFYEISKDPKDLETTTWSSPMPSDARPYSDRGRAPGRGRGHANNASRRPSQLQTSQPTYGPQSPVEGMVSPTFSAPYSPYPQQQSGFVVPYAIPSQQPTPYTYASSPVYPMTGMTSEGSMMAAQNIHGSYQSMMQPSVYPYPRHSPPDSSGSHPHTSYSPTVYSPAPEPSSHPPGSPHPQSQASPRSPFSPPGVFQPNFASGHPGGQYGFPGRPYPSQMYQAQYPSTYPQHYHSPTEPEQSQGGWWYVPSPVPTQQYDAGQSPTAYQSPYPVGYQRSPEVDASGAQTVQTSQQPSQLATPVGLGISSAPGHPLLPTSPAQLVPPVGLPGSASSHGSGRPSGPADNKHVVRKAWHPNPPTHRSEFVMWVGNVPSDASHDELWRFFNSISESSDPPQSSGVVSIFLISRSSCAFVNFETDERLNMAIKWFNGRPLRPLDPRCPRLVCRVRRKEDDLKAGVGGQRGMGMHTSWIREQRLKGKEREPSDVSASDDTTSSTTSDRLESGLRSLSLSSDDEGRMTGHRGQSGGSSGSYASTNSSFLVRSFPKRYFILKSLSQFDLDLSVQKGLWATQKHNEGILDQAFRTSKEVYLIFGVNKSGEFYGYAKMAGPIRQGESRVSWASRTDSSASTRSSISPVAGLGSLVDDKVADSQEPVSARPFPFFSPRDGRQVGESPQPVATPDLLRRVGTGPNTPHHNPQSAPAEMNNPHGPLSRSTPAQGYSLDQFMNSNTPPRQESFHLDPSAPIRAVRNEESPTAETKSSISSKGTRSSRGSKGFTLDPLVEEEEKAEGSSVTQRIKMEEQSGPLSVPEPGAGAAIVGGEAGTADDESWGESFKVEWIKTGRLPFYRTRSLRNPWNHDREVKVSRDGTELEPSVGQRLLEEWDNPEPEPLPQTPMSPNSSRRTPFKSPGS